MTTELKETMPDPDSNIQLGEGAVPAREMLGGEVSTVFVYRPDLVGYEHALAAVKGDQEMICGYALQVKPKSAQAVEQMDKDGKFVEVFITFEPVPAEVT